MQELEQAFALYNSGKLDKSKDLLENIILKNNANAEAIHLIGAIYLVTNNYNLAIQYIEQATALQPKNHQFQINLATAYQGINKFKKSEQILLDVLKENKNLLEANFNLGNLYMQTNKLQLAEKFYKTTIKLNKNYVAAYLNLGAILQQQRLYQQSLEVYLEALQYHNDYKISCNVGLIYLQQDKIKLAKSYLYKALSLNNNYAPVYNNLGIIYNQNNFYLATYFFAMGYKCDADNIESLGNLYQNLKSACQWDKLLELEKKLNDTEKFGETPFINISRTDNIQQNYKVAKKWSDSIKNRIKIRIGEIKSNRVKLSKIKLGYLSCDFYDHATLHLLIRMLELHDRNKFEVYIYSYNALDNSQYSKRIFNAAHKFISIKDMDDQQAARLIKEDHIDILVDLKGYTKNNRIQICAFRPAPVQVSYLGFPGTTGADFFDYIITDSIVTPKEQQRYYSEKFLYMPNCYQATDNSQRKFGNANQEYNTDTASIIDRQEFAFCCFNQTNKIEKMIFASWIEILQMVPNSKLYLWVDDFNVKHRLQNYAANLNLSSKRIIFLSKVSREQHLARIATMDLALDTRLYNGHTTTSDALWAQVPVITIQGKHFASRVSSSLLQAVGLSECITHSIEQYKQLAVELAINKDKLFKLKKKLAKNIDIMPLFNTQLFTRDIERILLSLL